MKKISENGKYVISDYGIRDELITEMVDFNSLLKNNKVDVTLENNLGETIFKIDNKGLLNSNNHFNITLKPKNVKDITNIINSLKDSTFEMKYDNVKLKKSLKAISYLNGNELKNKLTVTANIKKEKDYSVLRSLKFLGELAGDLKESNIESFNAQIWAGGYEQIDTFINFKKNNSESFFDTSDYININYKDAKVDNKDRDIAKLNMDEVLALYKLGKAAGSETVIEKAQEEFSLKTRNFLRDDGDRLSFKDNPENGLNQKELKILKIASIIAEKPIDFSNVESNALNNVFKLWAENTKNTGEKIIGKLGNLDFNIESGGLELIENNFLDLRKTAFFLEDMGNTLKIPVKISEKNKDKQYEVLQNGILRYSTNALSAEDIKDINNASIGLGKTIAIHDKYNGMQMLVSSNELEIKNAVPKTLTVEQYIKKGKLDNIFQNIKKIENKNTAEKKYNLER